MFEIGLVALFPELVEPVFETGVIGRARSEGLCKLHSASPRDFATDRHRTVDDRPYGGGPGMVIRCEPVLAAMDSLQAALPANCPSIVLSAAGKPFDQASAAALANGPGILLVAARYEGIDERIVDFVDYEYSIGDYVLSGGEIAAAVVADATIRLLPGVLGHTESAADDSFADGLLGFPQYTRPEDMAGRKVPEVLLGGDHAAIRRWRLQQALGRTWLRRPELLTQRRLSDEEAELLAAFRREREDR